MSEQAQPEDPGGRRAIFVEEDVSVRAKALEDVYYRAAGYGELIDEDTEDERFEKDDEPIIAQLVEMANEADVKARKERKPKISTRSVQMARVWPYVPGPGDFDEQEDPEAAAKAYSNLNGALWRYNADRPDGVVQSRLEDGRILCRSNATASGEWGVYSTKNWSCLLLDWVTPDHKQVEKAINKATAKATLGADRLPEHGRKFKRELDTTTRDALDAGLARVQRQIEANANGDEPNEVDDEPDQGDDE